MLEFYVSQSILHNWSHNKCVQILRNCQESMTNKSGKVIIVDIILNPGGDDAFDEMRINMDMIMLACFDGGKERTEVDWKRILDESGFPHYKVIKIPAHVSIIEALYGVMPTLKKYQLFLTFHIVEQMPAPLFLVKQSATNLPCL
ncbi:hypothetical protein L1987_24475 [Smallanthus sonchifolius]|uniref:Uncharacterized protein n=1 Tax=Smallanthus sonchifolius TaxID=185202 RepID=A0ACB9IJU4_9ASTR|nr:hypothetical protein L1987_24475 [Smallanthus sonchifolius]